MLFEVTDFDKKVYEEELRDFLPDKIIDVHCHVMLDSLRIRAAEPGVKRTVSWPSLVAKDNSIEDLCETYRLMFPDKEVTPLFFTNPYPDSMSRLNCYIADSAKKTGYPALYFSHPSESADKVEAEIRTGGFLGIKSYLDQSPSYIPMEEIRIYDFFPRHQLERMNQMGAIVMLHIPRNGRLKDPVNLEMIREIKEDFPRIRLIIAHIGRAYTHDDIGNAFEFLEPCKDLMFDFSANTNDYVMTRLLEAVGPKRVMFGSDFPILRMRTRRIEEGSNYVNLVPPGLYGDISGDSHMREVSSEDAKKITFFMYEEILAFKRAANACGLIKSDIEDVFCNNAQRLIDGARIDIYGK